MDESFWKTDWRMGQDARGWVGVHRTRQTQDTSDAQKPVSYFDLCFQFCITVTSALRTFPRPAYLGQGVERDIRWVTPFHLSQSCLLVFLDPRKTLGKEWPWSSPLLGKALNKNRKQKLHQNQQNRFQHKLSQITFRALLGYLLFLQTKGRD